MSPPRLEKDWTSYDLAQWIEREIPSFVGSVPNEYIVSIQKQFALMKYSDIFIQQAIEILEKRGVKLSIPKSLTEKEVG
jgi:hypothetical protein